MDDMTYQTAIKQLAKAHADILFSYGEAAQEKLEELVSNSLRGLPENWVIKKHLDHEILRRHAHNSPSESGTYLKLLHGRETLDEVMDDWGPDGPWIGPLEWFHCTYMTSMSLGFINGETVECLMQNETPVAPIFFASDMIYFDGMYTAIGKFRTSHQVTAQNQTKKAVPLPSRQRRLLRAIHDQENLCRRLTRKPFSRFSGAEHPPHLA
jgi:hypothetical protein